MVEIVVAVISALSAVAVALINVWGTRQRSPGRTLESTGGADGVTAEREQIGALRRAWARLWELLGRLPPLGRRRTP